MKEAERLIDERNKAAHGWLITNANDDIRLLAAKRGKGQRASIAVLELGWVIDRGSEIDQAFRDRRTAMKGTCAYIPGTIERLKAAKILD